jgi:hypothetical protein
VVLLSREGNRCLPTGRTHQIPLAVSHYGEKSLSGCVLKWTARGGPVNQRGEIAMDILEMGELTQIGSAEISLLSASRGCKIDLDVALHHNGREINSNNWSFWAMPDPGNDLSAIAPEAFIRVGQHSQAPIPPGTQLVIAEQVDQALADYVSDGGRCLLLGRGLAVEEPENIYQGYTTFRTIPWNGGPGNLGTAISDHPALASFPHEDACDFQFTWLISKAHPMNLAPLAPLFRDSQSRNVPLFGDSQSRNQPVIIRDIDWYRTNKNLAYMIEFNVGRGKVLATTLRILPTLNERLESRYLLKCLIDYAGGSRFTPEANVPAGDLLKWFGKSPA